MTESWCVNMRDVMARPLDIKLIVSDVDGVWTDGKIIYAGETREIKEFNVRDGLGAKLAQRGGVAVALLTSRRSPALARRARELGIEELHQGPRTSLARASGCCGRRLDRWLQLVHGT